MNRVLRTGVLVLFCAASAPAIAGGNDCAPLGALPSYQVIDGAPTQRDYAAGDFEVATADGSSTTTTVAGHYCEQHYEPRDGTEPLSNLEILSNYREQLARLGAKLVYSDDNDLYARLDRSGHQTWLKVYSEETAVNVTVVDQQPPKQVLTAPSGYDYPLLGHMPNYVADEPTQRNFDQFEFDVTDSNGDQSSVTVQGAKYEVSYMLRDNVQPNSNLDTLQNYRTALTRLGAQILFADENQLDARLEHAGKTVWLKVYSEDSEIHVSVIEEKPFEATIQPAKASALKAALDKDGHVALYVNFDFNKATLRADAAPVLAQVVAVLKDSPDLKLAIEGNTDSIGEHDYNQKLSGARAASVVAALVKAGIAADRLTASGNGADKPIADNGTPEGRAKNRRVELVKR
ncbi:MAG TPA: OmpA family protein [Solimonas sp.]|nr:OmpA family protein [Solimonas sp.]